RSAAAALRSRERSRGRCGAWRSLRVCYGTCSNADATICVARPLDACATPPMTTPTSRQQHAKDAINEALELFHRRWMLRVIWELREGAYTFRALQARCGDISPTVLNQR